MLNTETEGQRLPHRNMEGLSAVTPTVTPLLSKAVILILSNGNIMYACWFGLELRDPPASASRALPHCFCMAITHTYLSSPFTSMSLQQQASVTITGTMTTPPCGPHTINLLPAHSSPGTQRTFLKKARWQWSRIRTQAWWWWHTT